MNALGSFGFDVLNLKVDWFFLWGALSMAACSFVFFFVRLLCNKDQAVRRSLIEKVRGWLKFWELAKLIVLE